MKNRREKYKKNYLIKLNFALLLLFDVKKRRIMKLKIRIYYYYNYN